MQNIGCCLIFIWYIILCKGWCPKGYYLFHSRIIGSTNLNIYKVVLCIQMNQNLFSCFTNVRQRTVFIWRLAIDDIISWMIRELYTLMWIDPDSSIGPDTWTPEAFQMPCADFDVTIRFWMKNRNLFNVKIEKDSILIVGWTEFTEVDARWYSITRLMDWFWFKNVDQLFSSGVVVHVQRDSISFLSTLELMIT